MCSIQKKTNKQKYGIQISEISTKEKKIKLGYIGVFIYFKKTHYSYAQNLSGGIMSYREVWVDLRGSIHKWN